MFIFLQCLFLYCKLSISNYNYNRIPLASTMYKIELKQLFKGLYKLQL